MEADTPRTLFGMLFVEPNSMIVPETLNPEVLESTRVPSGYGKAGDLRPAELLLPPLLQGSRGQAQTVACTMLIDAYGKMGDATELIETVRESCFGV